MPILESKSFQRFNGRFSTLQQHSQTINVSLNKLFNALKTKRLNGKTISQNLNISTEKYPQLNIPGTEYSRVINFSRRENNDYCFLELFNLFSYYMKDILKEMYLLRPKSITQKCNKEITYSKISEFASLDSLVDYMIDDIFKELESIRSTQKLVKRILNHTKAVIPQNISDDALMYLNIRHLIIHNDSKVDSEFYEKYKNKLSISLNGKVPTEYSTFKSALESVYNYVKTIDAELISKNFINPRN